MEGFSFTAVAFFEARSVACTRLRFRTLLQSLSQTRLAHAFAAVSVVLNDKTTGPDKSGLRSLDHILWAVRSQTDEQTAE